MAERLRQESRRAGRRRGGFAPVGAPMIGRPARREQRRRRTSADTAREAERGRQGEWLPTSDADRAARVVGGAVTASAPGAAAGVQQQVHGRVEAGVGGGRSGCGRGSSRGASRPCPGGAAGLMDRGGVDRQRPGGTSRAQSRPGGDVGPGRRPGRRRRATGAGADDGDAVRVTSDRGLVIHQRPVFAGRRAQRVGASERPTRCARRPRNGSPVHTPAGSSRLRRKRALSAASSTHSNRRSRATSPPAASTTLDVRTHDLPRRRRHAGHDAAPRRPGSGGTAGTPPPLNRAACRLSSARLDLGPHPVLPRPTSSTAGRCCRWR